MHVDGSVITETQLIHNVCSEFNNTSYEYIMYNMHLCQTLFIIHKQ